MKADQERKREVASRSAGPSAYAASLSTDFNASYTLTKALEDPEIFAELQRNNPKRAASMWTPRRVAALDTDAIVQRLETLGVEVSHDSFIAQAKARSDAKA